MGSRYPERSKELNMTHFIGLRLSNSQISKLKEYEEKYKKSLSDIVREAIAIWINIYSQKEN